VRHTLQRRLSHSIFAKVISQRWKNLRTEAFDLPYDGQHYRTIAADLEPKPEHDIPIWLGTFGKRSLAVTGRFADGWIPSLAFAPPNKIPEMRDRMGAAAEEVGRDPKEIIFIYNRMGP
jgi:alkanesulfonate monooxygenase SsuD/methylene tetrahydromethanopterin reductase-like flavin-dependent oxidoreductase (luciferase family)